MATITATSAIEQALQELGVLGSGASATTAQKNNGLVILQNLIDWANGDPKMAVSSTLTTQALSNGVNSYTIGSGQAINVARPSKILAAAIQTPGPTMPIRVLDDAKQWTAIVDRDRTSYVVKWLWYDRGYTTGTIYLSPTPFGGTLEIVYPTLITNFADLTTPITISPAYSRWIVMGTAIELAGTYDLAVPESVAAAYQQALGTIQALNSELLGPSPAVPAIGPGVSA